MMGDHHAITNNSGSLSATMGGGGESAAAAASSPLVAMMERAVHKPALVATPGAAVALACHVVMVREGEQADGKIRQG